MTTVSQISSKSNALPKQNGNKTSSNEKKASDKQEITLSDLVTKICAPFEKFHDGFGKTYIRVPRDESLLTLEIKSKEFQNWLQYFFKANMGKYLRTQQLNESLALLEAQAAFDGKKKDINIRTALLNGKIYIDLNDDNKSCVIIDEDGYSISKSVDVCFLRKNGMAALPMPVSNTDINLLQKYINCSEVDFILLVAWMLGSLRGKPPYAILMLNGEQGSGKSTAAKLIRSCVDPSEILLRGVYNSERDLVISAQSSLVLAMDNLSQINAAMADALCRVASGGGFSTRKLHTDSDEVMLPLKNPIITTSIDGLSQRSDLLERSLCIEMLPLCKTSRITEDEIYQEFERDRPKILGALCNALSCALRRQNDLQLEELPRMADFAKFITAAEPAFGWEEGTFIMCLNENQDRLAHESINDNPFIRSVYDLMEARDGAEWVGTATQLKQTVEVRASYEAVKEAGWPKSAGAVGGLISRYQAYLRRLGYQVIRSREDDSKRERILTIVKELR